jgi:Holliday junction DNA helicase RuvA
MNIREDDISLYGFASQEELEIFKILLGINGVGPKAAISILTALTVQELYLAVISEDIKAITKANGIGTKGAQRIVLELKDKLKMEDMLDAAYDNSVGASPQAQDVSGDVVMALTSLGYSQSEAVMAIRKVDNSSDMDTEQLLKAALKKMI